MPLMGFLALLVVWSAARADGFVMGSDASAKAGALVGDETLEVSAATAEVEAGLEATLEGPRWRLEIPVEASHRQTFGASLDETQGDGEIEVRYRHSAAFRASAGAGVAGAWRPDWPDPYQVLADGSLTPTDRNSYWERKAGLELASIPIAHEHVEASFESSILVYQQDPSFEPIERPMHLTPDDAITHEGELSWTHYTESWKVGGGARGERESALYLFARDAGTGVTHSGPGGEPANPLQAMASIQPFTKVEYGRTKDPVAVDLEIALEIERDLFEGYYSYTGLAPILEVNLRPGERTEIELQLEGYARRYGPDSYSAGGTHPPLLWGSRRTDAKGELSFEATRKVAERIEVMVEAELAVRRTNYPTYEPGVFPAQHDYDIDWNYENFAGSVGLAWSL